MKTRLFFLASGLTLLAVSLTANAASVKRNITLRPGDYVDAKGVRMLCNYSRDRQHRLELFCAGTNKPSFLTVSIRRDRVEVLRCQNNCAKVKTLLDVSRP